MKKSFQSLVSFSLSVLAGPFINDLAQLGRLF